MGGIWKAGIAIGLYLGGFVYMAMKLNFGDKMFQSYTKKDEDYANKIKLDPFFHNFYIINTMKYFGISEKLMQKT